MIENNEVCVKALDPEIIAKDIEALGITHLAGATKSGQTVVYARDPAAVQKQVSAKKCLVCIEILGKVHCFEVPC